MIELLIELKLDQYIETFEDEGIDDVKTFNDYEDEDLLELGLKKPHIKRLRRYFEESSEVKEVSVESNDPWFLKIANDTTIWNLQLLESDIPIISHEYLRIKALMQEGQYFGVLLQIKDFFEILLKVPILIVLNDKFNSTDYSEAERNFILATLEKPLSLGHWHELASFIKKHTLHNSSVISSLVNNIFKLYNKNNIIKWRNDEIGHGALSLDDDQEFQDDIKAKLLILKKFLDDNFDSISTINFDTESKIVSYGESQCSFIPFFKEVDKKIYFFDSYLSRKQKVHQLNYCFGKKLISEIPDFDNFISSYEMTKREEQLSTCDIEEVRLAEEEKQLDILESSTEFLKPNYLVDWMKSCLSNYDKGKFLLQMQRGTGKSLFCKALDQLALNEIELHDDILVRSFYINDVFRSKLSDFTSEISFFILNKKLENKIFTDTFRGNIPSLNIESTKSDFAYLLNWYKQKYSVDKLLLIIDGVDEISNNEEKTIFDILPDNFELDDGIYLLLTSRTTDEITPSIKNSILKTSFDENKTIKKNSTENQEVLHQYIKKFKLSKNDTDAILLMEKSDFRLLYLNMLKEIILTCNINLADIPENERIIEFYLSEIKKKYGEKYFQSLFDLLLILASQLEEITINEIAYLSNDTNVSLKLLANLFDLRGFIKKVRNTRGNLLSLNHISIIKYFKQQYVQEIRELLKNVYYKIENADPTEEADIYKVAYLEDYENIYEINLSINLNSKIILDFILNIENIKDNRVVKVSILLINLLIEEGDIIKMIDYLSQLEQSIINNGIEKKINDDEFVKYITENIDLVLEQYDSNKYNLFKSLYVNFYKYSNRAIAFKIIDFLIQKDEKFNDILNYISMCKGDSKWQEATSKINQYLKNNNFGELQLAQFYYIVGRMYVDDIKNFFNSEKYLEQSIEIYKKYNENINANIVTNTLSMFYFSKGDYNKAYELLLPIYQEVMDDNGIIYDQNAIEAIYNNMYVYCIANKKPIMQEKISFLNKEVELYYNNACAVNIYQQNDIDNAKKIFLEALEVSSKFNKNYAKSALMYNYGIVFDNKKLEDATSLIQSNGYTMGKYIIENKDSSEHVLNTLKIDNKYFWLCVKNVDLLL
jgi:hypothetical protein